VSAFAVDVPAALRLQLEADDLEVEQAGQAEQAFVPMHMQAQQRFHQFRPVLEQQLALAQAEAQAQVSDTLTAL
jgi:hypothetical protein